MRDSFIFYRSFFEATKTLNTEQAADLYYAICSYALDREELELDNIQKALFSLIKPQLDANHKKWENGCKKKQTISKPKAKQKQKRSKTEANVNVNDNVNDNVNENIHTHFLHLSLTKDNYNKLVKMYSKDKVDTILEQIENYKGNTKYKSLYLTAKNWLKNESLKNPENEKKRASDLDANRAFGVSL